MQAPRSATPREPESRASPALVATASSTSGVHSTHRSFLAEVDMLIHRLKHVRGIEAHLLLGQEIAVPRLDRGAAGDEQQRESENQTTDPFVCSGHLDNASLI